MKAAGASEAKELGKTFETLEKGSKTLGRGVATLDAGISIYDAVENPTTANIVKAGVKTTLAVLEYAGMVNPIVGVGLAILDASGATNWILNKVF